MDDRQWIVTTALGGVFASAFLYLPWSGGFWTFLIIAAAQGLYLGWQDVTKPQGRLGYLSFGLAIFVGTGLMGVLLTRNGPGNLWGLAAMYGVASGLAAMLLVRLVKGMESKDTDSE